MKNFSVNFDALLFKNKKFTRTGMSLFKYFTKLWTSVRKLQQHKHQDENVNTPQASEVIISYYSLP